MIPPDTAVRILTAVCYLSCHPAHLTVSFIIAFAHYFIGHLRKTSTIHLRGQWSPSHTKYIYIKSTTVYDPRQNWDSPNPSLASECPSPRNRGRGEGGEARLPADEGFGESQFRRLEKKLCTLPTLCPHIFPYL
jgi:hypothetical protein